MADRMVDDGYLDAGYEVKHLKKRYISTIKIHLIKGMYKMK
jgi:hypothetical protein